MGFTDSLQHEMHSNIATLFLQIIFILSMCRIIGRVLQVFKQPPVVGEIFAGILMGPTVLGQSKEFSNFMFPKSSAVLLKGISDLGITFFMFILGLEFAPNEMLRSLKKTWLIGVCGIVLPFGLGAAIAPYLYEQTHMERQVPPISIGSFILFTGASMSFTAFPVLARILTANDAMTSQIGLVSMGVASVDDILAWTVLAIATSVTVGGSPQDGAWGVLIGIAYVIFLLVVVRSILVRLQPILGRNNFVVIIFLGMCASAWFTQVLGLHAFFGGFIFGLCVPKDDKQFVQSFIDELEVVVVNFFVPLFFANTGLRTDLTTLRSSVGPVLLVWALATVGKMIPPFFLGKCRGYSWRFSFELASLMNARGLIALIALDVALETRAFNNEMYSIFVVMALGTTVMAGPMFWAAYRPDLDPPTSGRELAAHKRRAEQKAAKKGQVAGVGSPRQASRLASFTLRRRTTDKEASVQMPDLEEVRPEESVCHELPAEEMMEPPAEDGYGYMFHGTVRPPQEEVRKSIAEVFHLPFLQRSASQGSPRPPNQGSFDATAQTTPKFDCLRATAEDEKELEAEEAAAAAAKDGTAPQTAAPKAYHSTNSSTILDTLTNENQKQDLAETLQPTTGPQRSPQRSPQKSPQKGPQKSPQLPPLESQVSPQTSPQLPPLESIPISQEPQEEQQSPREGDALLPNE